MQCFKLCTLILKRPIFRALSVSQYGQSAPGHSTWWAAPVPQAVYLERAHLAAAENCYLLMYVMVMWWLDKEMQLSLHAGVLPKKMGLGVSLHQGEHWQRDARWRDWSKKRCKATQQHQVNGSTKATGKPSVSKQKKGERAELERAKKELRAEELWENVHVRPAGQGPKQTS